MIVFTHVAFPDVLFDAMESLETLPPGPEDRIALGRVRNHIMILRVELDYLANKAIVDSGEVCSQNHPAPLCSTNRTLLILSLPFESFSAGEMQTNSSHQPLWIATITENVNS